MNVVSVTDDMVTKQRRRKIGLNDKNSQQTYLGTKSINIIEHFDIEVQLLKQLCQSITIHISTIAWFIVD